MTSLRRWVVPLWALVLALAICVPLLAPGYVLSYDMVWVPHLALTRSDVWGLGSGLPRAVPSDAFAALLGAVLPAALVQKAVLLGAVFLSGLGMGRLLRESPRVTRLAALTLYAWNPFVAERLALGQWPLLLAYAAVPWLVDAMRTPEGASRPAAIVALAATALTPATGLMGFLIALATRNKGQSLRLGFVALAVNAPWIVAGLLHTSIARTDAAAVALFEAQPEGRLGRVGAVLSLGGIWNREVVPTSRGLILAVALAVVMWTVMVVGLIAMWRIERRLLIGLGATGAVGLVLGLGGWLFPGPMTDFVRSVPAGGLLRDGTRYLLLLAPLEAVAFGFGAQRLMAFARSVQVRQFVAAAAILIPVVALPDLAWGVGGALRTADYPPSWYAARAAIVDSKVPGDILVLPFSSYRRPAWNHGRSVLDPAGRFFDRETVASDVLVVSGNRIAGEDPRASRIATSLRGRSPATDLARGGIGLVVVETDAGAVPRSTFRGMTRIQQGGGIEVFSVPKAAHPMNDDNQRLAVIAAWTVSLLALWFAATQAVLRRLRAN